MDEKKRSGGKGTCATCRYWRPHVVYDFVGYCEKHGRMTLEDDQCPFYEPVRIEEGEFYWCSTCKTRLAWDEAREYVKKGYRLHRRAYVEPDIKEELYGVF